MVAGFQFSVFSFQPEERSGSRSRISERKVASIAGSAVAVGFGRNEGCAGVVGGNENGAKSHSVAHKSFR
jgi:hypothetical protein